MSNSIGVCRVPHLSYRCIGPGTIAHHKNILGWIPAGRRVVVAAGTTTTVDLEWLAEPAHGDSVLMATIPIGGSATRFYTVEARDLVGYDREIPRRAVIIHEVDILRSDRDARVVDADHTGTPNDAGAVWLPGETFRDPANNIAVHVVAETASGFQVTIAREMPAVTLTVARTGAGAGRVTSAPAGIDCGTDCSQAFASLSVIRLHAAAAAGSVFTGWTSGGCTGVGDCSVTMTDAATVSARFVPAASLAPDLVVALVTNPPATATRSARFTVTTTVVNQGDGSAAASRLRFYLSTDALKDAADVLLVGAAGPTWVPSLAAGAAHSKTVTLTVPKTTPWGVYLLLACADSLNVVAERDERNNCTPSIGTVAVGP